MTPERLDINSPFLNRRPTPISSTRSQNIMVVAHSVRLNNVFNARAQRSWRRRLWHRPRTPSSSSSPPSSSPSSSPSSRRRERLDTIRARITKLGLVVELDEWCSHTKFDVTGYFSSPASGHFCKLFFKFLGPISPERLHINAPNLNMRSSLISSTSPNFMVLAHSFRLYNAKTFSDTQARIYVTHSNKM